MSSVPTYYFGGGCFYDKSCSFDKNVPVEDSVENQQTKFHHEYLLIGIRLVQEHGGLMCASAILLYCIRLFFI